MFESIARFDRLERQIDRYLPKQTATVELPTELLDFVPALSPRWVRPNHLAPVAEAFERATREELRLIISTPPQHGKAIASDTPMFTKRGWVEAGQVALGDWLVAADGSWTRVTGVFPQGVVPLYRVSFDDGTSLTTCSEHRWEVRSRDRRRSDVKTTGELIGQVDRDDGKGRTRRRWRIPVGHFEGTTQDLPICPYVLGLWLGDGSTTKAEITTADPEVVEAIRAAGFKTSYEYPAGRATTYGVLGLVKSLRLSGVLGNKHVPHSYKMGSVAQRVALLQGLCDSDGTVAKNGGFQSFTTTLERLAEDFRWLVNSLGGIWREYSRPAANKTAYTLSFRLPRGMSGFRLPRKRDRLNPYSARCEPRRFLSSIDQVEAGHAVCFSVDHPRRLFAAGPHMVLTHNTEVIKHGLVWLLNNAPHKRNGYVSYAAERSWRVSKQIQELADRAGLEPSGSRQFWETRQGGSIIATGIGGPLTGQPIDGVLVIDDPVKNRADAESPTIQENHRDWYNSTAETRLHPGASIILVMTRWAVNDLAGQLSRDGWEVVNLPAINDAREALWPELRPLEYLERQKSRIGEYDFASMYQGRPRPRGAAVFKDPSYYDELPTAGYKSAIGVDLAYTSKSVADYSVALVMVKHKDLFYVVDVIRKQVEAPEFCHVLKNLGNRYPGHFLWHCAGTEKGSAQFIKKQVGPRFRTKNAGGDKFVRSQPVAAAWNDGRVLLPRDAPWLDELLNEVTAFTGVKDHRDDQVDALASAFDALSSASNVSSILRRGSRGARRF